VSNAADVIKGMGGLCVSKTTAPFLHRKIERLAVRAGIQKPQIYVIPDQLPNACAVGLSANDSAVAVTTGLLSEFDEHEIEAVLAHEIGHIQKGHCIEKTKVAMKAMAIGMVAEMGGRSIASSNLDFTPGDDDSDDLLSTLLKVGLGVAVAAAGTAAAASLMTASSFQSEFEADECGGKLAKKPWALASALQKIEKLAAIGTQKFAPEVSQLFIVSPAYLNYKTHPATGDRVQRLIAMPTMAPKLSGVPTIFCGFCGEKTDSDGAYCYWCGCSLSTQ
jgi:heat shock protein HtpX